VPVKRKGAVKRVIKSSEKIRVRLSPEEKQAVRQETADVLRGLKKEEFNVIVNLRRGIIDSKTAEKKLMELSKKISSLERTAHEAPTLESKTLQRALEPQVGSLFVSRPGKKGYAEVKKNMNQIHDFINTAKDFMSSRRVSKETRTELNRRIREYEEQLKELEKFEKAYLKRKK